MRFRFCWDCDCPDWLLAEMANLSKIVPSKLLQLTQMVAQSICGEELNFEDVLKLVMGEEFDESAARSSVAAIRWIIVNAAGSDTEAQVLNSELQQLGLPKEQGGAIEKVFTEQIQSLKEALKSQSLKASGNVDWSYQLKGVDIGETKEVVVQLNMKGEILDQENMYEYEKEKSSTADKEELNLHLLPDQLHALLYELKVAHKKMEDIIT